MEHRWLTSIPPMNSCMKVCSLSCKSKSIRVGDGKHTLKMFQLALTKLSHAKLLLKQLLHFRCCHCFGKCQHPVWLVDGWCLCHYVFLHFWIQELKQSMEQKLLQTKFSRGIKRHACPTYPPPHLTPLPSQFDARGGCRNLACFLVSLLVPTNTCVDSVCHIQQNH